MNPEFIAILKKLVAEQGKETCLILPNVRRFCLTTLAVNIKKAVE